MTNHTPVIFRLAPETFGSRASILVYANKSGQLTHFRTFTFAFTPENKVSTLNKAARFVFLMRKYMSDAKILDDHNSHRLHRSDALTAFNEKADIIYKGVKRGKREEFIVKNIALSTLGK